MCVLTARIEKAGRGGITRDYLGFGPNTCSNMSPRIIYHLCSIDQWNELNKHVWRSV